MSARRRRELAAQQQIVETARSVAFLVATAETACDLLPKPKKRGPPPDKFTSELLRELVMCYREMFGFWPVVKRTEGENRGGPAMKWLQHVLVLARERFSLDGYKTRIPGNSSADSASPDELLAMIEKLLHNSAETLGSNFAKAITSLKPRNPPFR
jgi:hypothetical protein